MKDNHNREINYLRISVTDLCDLRCKYCMPEEGVPKKDHRQMMSVDEFIDAARAAASLGITKIRLTGGEPLVKRGIVGIVEGIAAIPGIEEVCMTTNAQHIADKAEALKAAGLTRINVSLDTLDADLFADMTRCGDLQSTLDGLEAMRAAGFTGTKINAVLMKGINDGDVVGFAEFAHGIGAELRFIEMMPMGALSQEEFEKYYVSADSVIEGLDGFEFDGQEGVAEMYEDARGVRIGFIRAISNMFCESCNKIRLTAEGSLKPCLHLEDGESIKGLDYEEMKSVMAAAIAGKPGKRNIMDADNLSEAGRGMSTIGG